MGAGRALIDELDAICRERGAQEMFVITNESNVAAMHLYESTGVRRQSRDDVVFVYSYC